MAEQETSPETPVTEATAPSEQTSVAAAVAARHPEDEIADENIYEEPEEVEAMESAPPPSNAAETPIEATEVRESIAVAPAAPKAEAEPEKQLGPLTGSGWMLAISIVTFILAIIVQAL